MSSHAAPLELRILDGWHAGARCRLPGNGRLSIGGPDDDADIVLRDLSFAESGELHHVDGQWHWRTDPAADALPIASDAVFTCGGRHLALQAEHTLWPADATLASAIIAPPAASEPAADPAPTSAETEPAPAPATHPAPTPAPAQRSRRILGVGTFALLGIVAFATTATALTRWATPVAPAPTALVRADLHALLAQLDLDAQLHILDDTSSAPRIHGFVADDATFHRLESALARLPQRPVLHVLSMADAVDRANDLVRTHAPGLQVEAATTGHFLIDGVAPDTAVPAELIDRLMLALPQGAVFSDHSLQTHEVESAFASLLVRHELTMPDIVWRNGQLEFHGHMAEEEIGRWENVMRGLDDLFGERVRFVARMTPPSPAAFLRRHVRAVVSGETPFVVTAHGDKVLLGGHVGRYRLLEIRDTLSVWEWPGGGEPFALDR